jgi:hypothetical protein
MKLRILKLEFGMKRACHSKFQIPNSKFSIPSSYSRGVIGAPHIGPGHTPYARPP